MKAKWIAIALASVIVVGVAAGIGGYTLGEKAGQTRAADIRASFLAARGAGSGPQGAAPPGQGAPGAPGAGAGGQNGGPTAGAQFNPANFAAGQVKQVDGNTVQLSTATEVLKVTIGDQTRIQKMADGSMSDIGAGERITVQGTRKSDGTFAAQTIQIGGGPAGGNPPPAPAEATK
jgi:hypothetical protein